MVVVVEVVVLAGISGGTDGSGVGDCEVEVAVGCPEVADCEAEVVVGCPEVVVMRSEVGDCDAVVVGDLKIVDFDDIWGVSEVGDCDVVVGVSEVGDCEAEVVVSDFKIGDFDDVVGVS